MTAGLSGSACTSLRTGTGLIEKRRLFLASYSARVLSSKTKPTVKAGAPPRTSAYTSCTASRQRASSGRRAEAFFRYGASRFLSHWAWLILSLPAPAKGLLPPSDRLGRAAWGFASGGRCWMTTVSARRWKASGVWPAVESEVWRCGGI